MKRIDAGIPSPRHEPIIVALKSKKRKVKDDAAINSTE